MSGKQAKLLTQPMVRRMLSHVRTSSRYPLRNKVMILLSVKAGLRASEIAKLTWDMVLDANGRISKTLELHDCAAKNLHGRVIPLHGELQKSLMRLYKKRHIKSPYVITSERGTQMRPSSVVNWFKELYDELELEGCSSHSGRRSFVTQAARKIHLVGGSLKDVQQLAGHRSLETTQAYTLKVIVP